MPKGIPKSKQEVLPPVKGTRYVAPKGNQHAKGNPGPWGGRPVTSVILQKLNEVNKTTNRKYIWQLVDELFEAALSREEVIRRRDGSPVLDDKGKPMTIRVLGDMDAMKEIINRSDGRPKQDVKLKGGGTVILHFDAEDQDA
jgi:hypothetical protein